MGQRPNELTPHKSAQHYWGAELRKMRNDRGISLGELGRRIHRDRSYLAKVERGERTIPADLARDCDDALDTRGTLTRLHEFVSARTGEAPDQAIRNQHHVANDGPHVAGTSSVLAEEAPQSGPWDATDEVVVVPARTSEGRVIFVSVSRRHFLQGIGGTAAGLALAQPSIPGLPASVSGLPAPDVNPVAHFEQMRKVLIDSDNFFGPARVLATVREHIPVIQQLRESQRGTDQQALLHTQTKFAEFAGWLHQDAGDHHAAQYWTDRALQWSYGTRDTELTTFVLARKAQLAGDMGHPLDTIEVATAAENMAPPRSRLQAVAATFGAHGHALRGDRDSTLRAYDHARELLESVDDHPDAWGVWLDAAYVELARLRSLSALGDFTGAAEGFHAAIATLPEGFHRDKGVYLARAAKAHAGAHDTDHAATLGQQALTIGTETGSARILTELAQLDDTLTKQDTASVREFHEAMHHTISHQVRA